MMRTPAAGSLRDPAPRAVAFVRSILCATLGVSALLKGHALAEGALPWHVPGDLLHSGWVIAAVAVAEALAVVLVGSRNWRAGAGLCLGLGVGFGVVFGHVMASGAPIASCNCFGRVDLPAGVHVATILGTLLGARFLLLS